MLRLSSLRTVLFTVSVLSLSSMAPGGSFTARPFDWQYSRISTPFAVFYNPALLGNNPGYTLGFDVRHVDSTNYDFRLAAVVPVGNVLKHGEHIRANSANNRFFRYPNASYMSSKSAVAVGAMYADTNDYRFSIGFVAPVYLVQTGVSVDVDYKGKFPPTTAMNVGFNADAPVIMRGGLLKVGLHNLIVANKPSPDTAYGFGLSVGTAGVPFGDPRMYSLPYDLLFYFHMGDGGVQRVEGTARVNLDLASAKAFRGETGQAFFASLGYNFSRRRGGSTDHKFFGSVGVVFVNRASSAAILGSYGEGDETHGALFYNAFRMGDFGGDNDIFAEIGHRDVGDQSVLFHMNAGGTSVKSWVLRIDDPRGRSVQTFTGGNAVPSSIRWDGKDPKGVLVEDEILYAKLVLKGEKRVVESNTVTIDRGGGRP